MADDLNSKPGKDATDKAGSDAMLKSTAKMGAHLRLKETTGEYGMSAKEEIVGGIAAAVEAAREVITRLQGVLQQIEEAQAQAAATFGEPDAAFAAAAVKVGEVGDQLMGVVNDLEEAESQAQAAGTSG